MVYPDFLRALAQDADRLMAEKTKGQPNLHSAPKLVRIP